MQHLQILGYELEQLDALCRRLLVEWSYTSIPNGGGTMVFRWQHDGQHRELQWTNVHDELNCEFLRACSDALQREIGAAHA